MRRVYTIWFVRRVAPVVSCTGFFAFVALRETAEKFFVAQIVSNFFAVTASNIWAAPGFLGAAVRHAESGTLFIIAFSILATFMMSVKLLRNIRTVALHGEMAPELDYHQWQ